MDLADFSEFSEAKHRAMTQRLTAHRLELDKPYTGDGIEFLDRARPYLPELDAHGYEKIGEMGDSILGWQARDVLAPRFSWAVPNEDALQAIAKLSPIVEVGAGSGYWAKLLRERGAKVAPYDIRPYPLFNGQITYAHAAVAKGGPERALRHHPKRTLLLCWPSYDLDWAARALELHEGEHLVYVGEGLGGCTANERFHELLNAFYDEIETIMIPRWFGVRDWAMIYRRLDET